MPTLVLLRHAKAEAHRADDHSRHLAARGKADATAVRDWLQDKGIRPDRVVVSTSQRTRETWELADPGGPAAVYDDRVYEASVGDLLDVIGQTPEGIGTLVLVGHNPSIEQLAWQLDDSDSARDVTNLGLPTSALAVFMVPSWAQLGGAQLRETAVVRG